MFPHIFPSERIYVPESIVLHCIMCNKFDIISCNHFIFYKFWSHYRFSIICFNNLSIQSAPLQIFILLNITTSSSLKSLYPIEIDIFDTRKTLPNMAHNHRFLHLDRVHCDKSEQFLYVVFYWILLGYNHIGYKRFYFLLKRLFLIKDFSPFLSCFSKENSLLFPHDTVKTQNKNLNGSAWS